jgi:feruloyl esterase
LKEALQFGANPGNLRMLKYVPAALPKSPALIVVLHGCTQTAASYDRGAGWSEVADQHGFALLFPEQKRQNNPKNCFTWFDAGDTRRGAGEAASIRNMIETMIVDHGVDTRRVFITGLSAGGAMTSVMLATYPEVFAAGAIIAGLPFGAASSVQEAFHSMFQGSSRSAEEWGDLVRGASPHIGPWPRVSVWHGSADKTVVPGNADEIVKQWTNVHGARMSHAEKTSSHSSKSVWRNEDGVDVVESVLIHGLAHGTPLAVSAAGERCGEAGPFLLDVGVSSTHHVGRFFDVLEPLSQAAVEQTFTKPPEKEDCTHSESFGQPAGAQWMPAAGHNRSRGGRSNIHEIITRALRSAGLIKHG